MEALTLISVETSNLARKYTPICSSRKYTFQWLKPLNLADVSIFLKKIVFFSKKSTCTQNKSVRAMLEVF